MGSPAGSNDERISSVGDLGNGLISLRSWEGAGQVPRLLGPSKHRPAEAGVGRVLSGREVLGMVGELLSGLILTCSLRGFSGMMSELQGGES